MDYTFANDFGAIVAYSAAFGALGGLVWDIGYSISGKKPQGGLENHLTLPHLDRETTSVLRDGHRRKESRVAGIDLGFLGPLILGATVGILVVLTMGRTGPSGADVLQQLTRAADGGTADTSALATGVNLAVLAPLALLGGFGGWGVLQVLSARFLKVAEEAETKTKADAIATVDKKATELKLTKQQQDELVRAVATPTP